MFRLVGEVIVIPIVQSVVGGFLVHHLVHLTPHLRVDFVEEEDFLVHHDVGLVLLFPSHFYTVASVLILILNLCASTFVVCAKLMFLCRPHSWC